MNATAIIRTLGAMSSATAFRKRFLRFAQTALPPLPALLLATGVHADICRVTTAGTDSGDGGDWVARAMDMNSALANIRCDEVWVAGGVYTPSDNSSFPNAQDSFVIAREVEVYGGFDGTETVLAERDPHANPTVLSGDIDDNDVTNDDGVTETADDIVGNNSWHLMIIDGTTASGPITAATVLDGLILTAGEAINNTSALPGASAGALFCDGRGSGNECSPTLNNVTFSGNFATFGGGAMYSIGGDGDGGGVSNPVLSNVTFSGNRSSSGSGGGLLHNGVSSPTLNNVTFSDNTTSGFGGGMASIGTGSPTLDNVTFSGNSAVNGGAMYMINLSGTISAVLNNVTFVDNSAVSMGGSADGWGGAIHNDGASPVLNNVTFSGNSATHDGGAMNNDGRVTRVASPVLNNVTFSDNSAARGGAMFNNGRFGGDSSPGLDNVILWGNDAPDGPDIYNNFGTPEINDSIVQGGCPDGSTCNNVIDQDPLLGPLADNGGFTRTMLPGAAGAAIDAGNNATCLTDDQRGISRPQGAACDIGAVERVPVAGFDLAVNVSGQGSVDASADPVPLEGGITGCDVSGQGQPHCMATYTEDDAVTLNLTPAAGWHIESASGCGGVLDASAYTTAPLTAGCTVEVAFAIDQYTLEYFAGPGGNVTGDTPQTVDHGADGDPVTATPDTGYHFVQWSDGSTANPRTDTNVMADLGVTAGFALNEYTVTATAGGNGAVSPASQTVEHGQTAVLTVTPDAGYMPQFGGDCPAGVLAGDSYTTGPVTADCAVAVSFTENPPAVLEITGGDDQSTLAGTAFDTPLTVRVTDADGAALAGVTVTFEVQPDAGGAGAMLSATTMETGPQGMAETLAEANAIAGAYTVSVSAAGVEPVIFALRNAEQMVDVQLFVDPVTAAVGDTVTITAMVSAVPATASRGPKSASRTTRAGGSGPQAVPEPTGVVEFLAGAQTLCPAVQLSAGVAQCATDQLAAGEQLVEARYSGDGAHAGASASVTVVIEAVGGMPGADAPAVAIPAATRPALLVMVLLMFVLGMAFTPRNYHS